MVRKPRQAKIGQDAESDERAALSFLLEIQLMSGRNDRMNRIGIGMEIFQHQSFLNEEEGANHHYSVITRESRPEPLRRQALKESPEPSPSDSPIPPSDFPTLLQACVSAVSFP